MYSVQLVYGILILQATADALKNLPQDYFLKNSFNTFKPCELSCPFRKVNCDHTSKYRTISGVCNNNKYPLYGSANTPFIRYIPNAYDDHIRSPRNSSVTGGPLLSARAVSTTVFDPNNEIVKETDINLFMVFFAQFMSHDFTRFAMGNGDLGAHRVNCCTSENRNKAECLPILVPANDPFSLNLQITCLHFLRSKPTISLLCNSDVREQLNEATSYIDGSAIYGSSENDLKQLRLFNKGLMKTVPCASEVFPPIDKDNRTECSVMPDNRTFPCFIAGDVRINENPALAVNHIIWLREHNWHARQLSYINPHWQDEKLFQESRKIVSAELQHIFYDELLPLLIGQDRWFSSKLTSSAKYEYNPIINPAIGNGLATAAFRFGHGMLPDNLLFIGGCPHIHPKCTPGSLLYREFSENQNAYTTTSYPPMDFNNICLSVIKENLSDIFEKVDPLFASQTEMDSLLRGLLDDTARIASDTMLTSAVTQRLFGNMDLMARNIQRGRDHGLPSYNVWRKWCGLKLARQFHTQINGFIDHYLDVVVRFSKIYAHPNDVDLVIGGLTEIPIKGSVVGPTYACIMARQFHDLKFGDRFWYQQEKEFSKDQLNQIMLTNMNKVLIRNTKLNVVPSSAFCVNSDTNPFVNREDIETFDLSPWKDTDKVI